MPNSSIPIAFTKDHRARTADNFKISITLENPINTDEYLEYFHLNELSHTPCTAALLTTFRTLYSS